jgi:hypothetical protein
VHCAIEGATFSSKKQAKYMGLQETDENFPVGKVLEVIFIQEN